VVMDPQLPNGPWEAKLRLESGLVEHVATAPITFPEVGRQAVTAPVHSAGMVRPAIGFAALGVLLLGALAWWLRRRKTGVRQSGRSG
jgi:LPXTG-motif cell wall-anchored protein